MRQIKDAEVRAKFDEAMEEIPVMIDRADLQKLYQHLFQAGRDSLVKELMDIETIAARKPKRTVQTIISLYNSNLYALSTDGKVFWLSHVGITGNKTEWIECPDLPQES